MWGEEEENFVIPEYIQDIQISLAPWREPGGGFRYRVAYLRKGRPEHTVMFGTDELDVFRKFTRFIHNQEKRRLRNEGRR